MANSKRSGALTVLAILFAILAVSDILVSSVVRQLFDCKTAAQPFLFPITKPAVCWE